MAIQDNATKQLGALPFGNIIGGPLVAAVEAQAKAARSTVEFIQSVAFAPLPEDNSGPNTPRSLQNIQFQYESKNPAGEV